DMAITRNVEKHLLDSKFNLLSSSEIATLQNVPISHLLQLLHILKNDNKIVEINRDLWIHAENLKSLKSKVRQFFEKNSRMSVVDFKSFTNTTRKHAIPLLEYLDRHEITMRDGNVRILL
ncbi:MAG: SelB C-terminal domain-containing protein, partial [Candidatus Marinimicrobia bacterium]|nr:SelB C-terminal domain-containing protein [Candidatus Neomarinimicrobiota bacterium]